MICFFLITHILIFLIFYLCKNIFNNFSNSSWICIFVPFNTMLYLITIRWIIWYYHYFPIIFIIICYWTMINSSMSNIWINYLLIRIWIAFITFNFSFLNRKCTFLYFLTTTGILTLVLWWWIWKVCLIILLLLHFILKFSPTCTYKWSWYLLHILMNIWIKFILFPFFIIVSINILFNPFFLRQHPIKCFS
jgi:hypothetical protein